MKKRIFILTGIILFIILVFRLHTPHEMTVVGSYSTVYSDNNCDENIIILLNKLWTIKNQEQLEEEILTRYKNNNFKSIQFSRDVKVRSIHFDVYLNQFTKKREKVLFSFDA